MISQYELELNVHHAMNQHYKFMVQCDYSEASFAKLYDLSNNLNEALLAYTNTKEYRHANRERES